MKETKRVLIVQNHLGAVGGVESHVESEVAALHEAGYEVAIFALSGDSSCLSRPGVTVYWRKPPKAFVRKAARFLFHPGVALKLRRTVSSFQPDWIHLHTIEQPYTILPALYGQRIVHSFHITALACPLSTLYYRDTLQACPGGIGRHCIRHTCVGWMDFPLRLAHNRAQRFLINRVATFCTSPSQTLHNLLQAAGIERDRVLPLFPNISAAPVEGERSRHKVLYVGALTEPKGIDLLLKAFPSIQREVPEVILDVVGNGTLHPKLVALSKSLGIADRVTFHGRQGHAALAGFYDRAAVCVIPSIVGETFNLVAYEALSRGCPVVATRRGALRDVIRDGETGILVEPTDLGELSAGVVRCLTDIGFSTTLSSNGRVEIEKLGDGRRYVDDLESMLETSRP